MSRIHHSLLLEFDLDGEMVMDCSIAVPSGAPPQVVGAVLVKLGHDILTNSPEVSLHTLDKQ